MANHWLNRTPDSFPIAFHEVVKVGHGVIPVPTGRGITGVRLQFASFLRVLAALPRHALHRKALVRWSIEYGADRAHLYACAHHHVSVSRLPIPDRDDARRGK